MSECVLKWATVAGLALGFAACDVEECYESGVCEIPLDAGPPKDTGREAGMNPPVCFHGGMWWLEIYDRTLTVNPAASSGLNVCDVWSSCIKPVDAALLHEGILCRGDCLANRTDGRAALDDTCAPDSVPSDYVSLGGDGVLLVEFPPGVSLLGCEIHIHTFAEGWVEYDVDMCSEGGGCQRLTGLFDDDTSFFVEGDWVDFDPESNFVCDDGQVCGRDRLCGPPPSICIHDRDCPAGEVCVQGNCVPRAADCAGGCGEGQQCVDGRCELPPPPPPPMCRPGAGMGGMCLPHQMCQQGRCLPCAREGDCLAGEVCQAEACVPAPAGCTAHEDCGGAGACVRGQCVDRCDENMDCIEGYQCVRGPCDNDPLVCLLNGERPACEGDGSQCPNGDADCPGDQYCTGFECLPLPPGVCRSSDNCPEGQGCVNRQCVAGGCVDDRDCGEAELCDLMGRCIANPTPTCESTPPYMSFGPPEELMFTLSGASRGQGSCADSDGPEFIFQLTAQAVPVCVSTARSQVDTVVYRRTEQCNAASEVDCNDDARGTAQAQIEVPAYDEALHPEMAHFIFVDTKEARVRADVVIDLAAGACP